MRCCNDLQGVNTIRPNYDREANLRGRVGCRITRMLFTSLTSLFNSLSHTLLFSWKTLLRCVPQLAVQLHHAFRSTFNFKWTGHIAIPVSNMPSPKWSCYVQRSIIASLEKPPQHLSPFFNLQQPLAASQVKNQGFPRKITWAIWA